MPGNIKYIVQYMQNFAQNCRIVTQFHARFELTSSTAPWVFQALTAKSYIYMTWILRAVSASTPARCWTNANLPAALFRTIWRRFCQKEPWWAIPQRLRGGIWHGEASGGEHGKINPLIEKIYFLEFKPGVFFLLNSVSYIILLGVFSCIQRKHPWTQCHTYQPENRISLLLLYWFPQDTPCLYQKFYRNSCIWSDNADQYANHIFQNHPAAKLRVLPHFG